MGLRNLPTDAPMRLSDLTAYHPGHVSSRTLTTLEAGASITVLAFDDGESVSEEEYFGDMLYYAIEGSCDIVLPNRRVALAAGEVLMVPAHVLHAVEGRSAFKLLQVCV